MKKPLVLSLSIALMLTLILSSTALATIYSVYDLNTDDLNSIVSQEDTEYGYVVNEDYNETHLIPYPSHDGWAIVNSSGEFFQKSVSAASIYPHDLLIFNVTNTTPYVWSDYHFIISESYINVSSSSSSVFTNSKFENSELSFWSPGWVNPGDTVSFTLDLGYNAGFYITQIATTAVPIPAAVWLFGSGLLGLLRFRKRVES